MKRMTRAEAQRRDCGVERYYCFMVRQKGEETKIWELAMYLSLGSWKTEESPGPRKRRKSNAQPALLDYQHPRAPVPGLSLRCQLVCHPMSPVTISQEQESSKLHHVQRARRMGGGASRRGPGPPMEEMGLGDNVQEAGRWLEGPGTCSPRTRRVGGEEGGSHQPR